MESATVLALPGAEASRGRPVRLQGVVTCYSRSAQLCFVQDHTGGIFLYGYDPQLELAPGSFVEVTGLTSSGRYSPIVTSASILVLGKTNLPPAKPVTIQELLSGGEDAQWIQCRGVVLPPEQKRGPNVLVIGSGSGFVQIHLLATKSTNLVNLVDSLVLVRGVAGTLFDSQQRLAGFNIYLSDESSIEVLRPGNPDPWHRPLSRIADLNSFTQRRLEAHRVRVQGTVLDWRANGTFHLRDDSGAAEIEGSSTPALVPGDVVQVVGFPIDQGARRLLRGALVRRESPGSRPAPTTVPTGGWQTGVLDNELVAIDGTFLAPSPAGSNRVAGLILAQGEPVSLVAEDGPASIALAALAPGSRVRTAGICEVLNGKDPGSRLIRVRLSAAEPIQVTGGASWWHQFPVWFLAGAIVGLAGAGAARIVRRRSRSGRPASANGDEGNGSDLAGRYHDLFENANDIICTLDPTGRITSINRAGTRILGYSGPEACGLNISQLVVPADWPRLRRLLEANQGQPTAVNEPFEMVTREGQRVVLEINARPITEAGRFGGVDLIARDITERRRTETELVRTAEGLQHSLAERERIGRDLHDNVIQSIYAVGLTLDECRRSFRHEPLRTEAGLDQGIDALNAVIREVRQFIVGLGPELLQGGELEGALKSLVLTMSSAQTVRFSLNFESEVSSALDNRRATEIFLITRELMSNCLRHSRASSALISIRLGRDQVLLRIEDDGTGFDAGTGRPDGHGLKNIAARAREINAEFQISSSPGKGSVFTLDVPVAQINRPHEIKDPPNSPRG